MTLELSFSIISFTILLLVTSFVFEIYMDLSSTCSREKENQQKDLDVGISRNSTGAERKGPVEHDERLCPGVSITFIIKYFFMIEKFNKERPP